MGTTSGGNPSVHVGVELKAGRNLHIRKGSPPNSKVRHTYQHPPFSDNYGGKQGLPATYKRPVLKAVSTPAEKIKANFSAYQWKAFIRTHHQPVKITSHLRKSQNMKGRAVMNKQNWPQKKPDLLDRENFFKKFRS